VHDGDVLQLWLGEAKFYRDVVKAVRAALSDLQDHLEQDYLRAEFGLIADKIDNEHPHASELRQLMHPNTSLDSVFAQIVVPVLVTYDSEATLAHDRVSTEYLVDLEAEVRRAWMRFGRGLDTDLPVAVRLFLIPLATKKLLLEELDREIAVAWH
jgi:hypothetical protein